VARQLEERATSLRLGRYCSVPAIVIGVTLAASAAFKVAAFAREAFIAARFGLSAVTDAYFGLRQFPMAFATFMFGAFALAFTPAYAEARRRAGEVDWLPGLLWYSGLLGTALTGLMLLGSPCLLRLFHDSELTGTRNTLAILSICYIPIAWIGIWAGICTARGHNVSAIAMTGLPHLLMTVALLAIYAAGTLTPLSLPITMTVGFGLIGLYSLVRILGEKSPYSLRSMVLVWKVADFRRFLRQLGTSSVENCGFAANQLLILCFLSRAGVGVISANNCAMRIGMLGFTLLGQPLAQLVQARLCTVEAQDRPAVFRRWLVIAAALVFLAALVLFSARGQIIQLVYMHGKFGASEKADVLAILPAWIGYFVVMSLNPIVARYLFTSSMGSTYVRGQLVAYAAANLLRYAFAARIDAASIIWFSVLAELCAFHFNLRACFADQNEEERISGVGERGWEYQ
jgi:putative peptidoglycan lipid II flippase